MAPSPRCSECGASLAGKLRNTKTCSPACRNRRSRRIRAARSKGGQQGLPEHLSEISQVVNGQTKDVAHEVLKEELRPVVREALTDDVLRGLHGLLQLTPRMVELIAADMESPDDAVRQKAYSLVARYTLGNQSVAPPPAEQSPSPLTVVFEMPRPGDTTAPRDEPPPEADVVQACVECGVDKPLSDFVAGSQRCLACQHALEEQVRSRFGDPA